MARMKRAEALPKKCSYTKNPGLKAGAIDKYSFSNLISCKENCGILYACGAQSHHRLK